MAGFSFFFFLIRNKNLSLALQPVILPGFPRRRERACIMHDAARSLSSHVPRVFNLDYSISVTVNAMRHKGTINA